MPAGWVKTSVVAFSFLLISTVASASEQGRFEKKLSVSAASELEVLTRSGNITVHGGPGGSISIIGRIHVGDRWFNGGRKDEVQAVEQNPPISQNGNSVRVDYVNYRDISIDYEVTAPPDTRLRTKSSSGDHTIEGMKAGATIETGSGDVRIRDLGGGIRIYTGSGNVQAREAAGSFDAHTGSGDISLEANGKGDVRVETGSGNVQVRGVDGGLWASTGSGDVRVDGNPSSSWSVKTGSGNADIKVPEQAAFDVDLVTSSGSIVIDQPVTTTVQGRVQEMRKKIRGKVRGGGPEIAVHIGSGDIRVN